jgi:replicative DNA helicase
MTKHATPSLPHNAHSERVILGALVMYEAHQWEDAKALREYDFYLDTHKRIFAAIWGELIANRPVDIVLLCDLLERKKELDMVGGPGYIASLTEGIPRNLDLMGHIKMVREKARLRRLLEIFHAATTQAYDQVPSAEIVATVVTEIGALHGGLR